MKIIKATSLFSKNMVTLFFDDFQDFKDFMENMPNDSIIYLCRDSDTSFYLKTSDSIYYVNLFGYYDLSESEEKIEDIVKEYYIEKGK